jgi:hypothetical protein
MKKFLVVFVVLALVCLGSIAFAAVDVSVGGSVQIRSRDFVNLRFNNGDAGGTYSDTQERVELDVNVKAGDDVRGKIALWNDFNDWGTIEQQQGNGFGNSISSSPSADHFGFREAWLSFNMPGIPVNVTAGHQLLALGQGFFLRNKHFGDDAWVVANVTGPNTAAFVNIKAQKNTAAEADSAVDAYAFLDVYKINDNNTVGADLSYVDARTSAVAPYPVITSTPNLYQFANIAGSQLYNLGLNYTGKLGPVNLKGEADLQGGRITPFGAAETPKFRGNQIVIQGNMPMDPVTFEFTLARGSGNKDIASAGHTNPNIDEMVTFLDIDPHYTFLYEYKTITAAGVRNTGFSNTTAASIGANANVTKSVNVALDLWGLWATEKSTAPLALSTGGTEESNYAGTELDATINWKLYDNLTWNWMLGYYKPGSAMRAPGVPNTTPSTGNIIGYGGPGTPASGSVGGSLNAVTGIQGVLSLNF